MDKKSFSEYLRARIGESRNVKSTLARLLNVHGSNVTKYLRGSTIPAAEKVVQIAEFFNDDPSEVLQLAGYPTYAGLHRGVAHSRVPIVGYVSGGPVELEYEFGDSGFPAGLAADYLEVEGVELDENDYALKISGDSLAPAYPDGTLLLISPAKTFIPNSLCAVRAVDGRCWVKFVSRSNEVYTLSSVNPMYPPFSLGRKEIQWIHPVKWIKLP